MSANNGEDGLAPCSPHDLGKTFFNVFDKRARFRWTSLDPENKNGFTGTSVMDLYPPEVRDAAFAKISGWLLDGEAHSYIYRGYMWPREVPDRLVNLKITMLPFDYGELAGISIATNLPDNYHELADDDFILLRLMAKDRPLKEIAHEMSRSKSAIDARIKSLKMKLGCQTIGGLVALAFQCALI